MKIIESGNTLKQIQIASVEKELGFTLPKDYVNFLLKNNGGKPDDNYSFSFYEQGIPEKTDTVVKVFYDINLGNQFDPNDLVGSYRALVDSEQIPVEFLPIAEDVFGNLIIMACNKEHWGSIYFGNAELENVETGYIAMSFVANSFSEFLDLLYLMRK